jgi:signal transduction histidine kinase
MTSTPAPSYLRATPSRSGYWQRYLAMWPRTGREILGLGALFGLAVAGFSASWALFSWGLGTLVAFLLGVFVIVGAFYVARGLGTADLAVLEWAGMPRIQQPAWRRERPGFWGWLRSLYGNVHYWLYLAYSLLPQFVLAVVTFVMLMTWIGVALGGLSWFAWSWTLPHDGFGGRGPWGIPSGFFERFGIERPGVLAGVVQTVVGILFLYLLPYVTRGLTWAHWGLARGMLGTSRSETLEVELAGAEASRAAAVAAEDTALRRLERDIHDGPQQRLVRLQMDLASAGRRLADDPEEALSLIASASEQAKEALEELRALSRGIAPPILLDRGLVAALESSAIRSTVPVVISATLPEGLVLPPEVERNAYFIASEAMTNAAKHAEAQRIVVRVSAPERTSLVIEVVDDGRGGAVSRPGHGLAGLADRAQGLGGVLEIDSPVGGPTSVVARLPIPAP